MAPITDTAVDELKSTVSRLEQRIVELENRLSGQGGSAPAASQESVRMILMGPPGAGEWFR
jgi:adenylate kinase